MIDLRRVKVLRELERHGTIAATAEAMHLTPSAVSQTLAALSRETGTTMLDPDGRRVRLTPAARVLVHHADRIFAQLEQAEADIADAAGGGLGWLTIAAFPTAMTGFVVPAVVALRQSRPRLTIGVVDVESPQCFDELMSGSIDIAVSMQHHATPSAADPRFEREPLLVDPLDAVLPADHPAANKTRLRLADLADDPWVAGLPGTTCQDIAAAACAVSGFTPNVRHRVDDYSAVLGLVAGGCGVAVVPRLAGLQPIPGLVIRQFSGVVPERHLFSFVRRGSASAPHVRAALDALRTAAMDADQRGRNIT